MNANGTSALPANAVIGHIRSRSCGQIPAGRSMIRSANGGGSNGLATVGCDQAEGSPKGGGPVAGAMQRRKQPPTCPAHRQARVCSDGAAPKASSKRDGRDRPELARRRALGSGPMSFALGTHQRPVGRVEASSQNPRGAFRSAEIHGRADLPKNLRAAPTAPSTLDPEDVAQALLMDGLREAFARRLVPTKSQDLEPETQMHTKDILAAELTKAGLPEMAAKAATGWYHDFLSPLAMPCQQLANDLQQAGTPAALALRARHLNGEFDATAEESDDWARSPEGREAFAMLTGRAG